MMPYASIIKAWQEDASVWLIVTDNGKGFSSAFLKDWHDNNIGIMANRDWACTL